MVLFLEKFDGAERTKEHIVRFERKMTRYHDYRRETGGIHGCFNGEAVQALDGREVILFPDLKATEEWRQRLPMLEPVCRRATCSDLLERIATDVQRSQGLDIADFLLMEDTPQMILQQMTARNPVLQSLIDAFGLELIDAKKTE